jgi:hypothetical protein
MSRIWFDPVRSKDGGAAVRATIVEYDERGDVRHRTEHVMTVDGARVRHGDFAAAIADAECGMATDDSLRARDFMPTMRQTSQEEEDAIHDLSPSERERV